MNSMLNGDQCLCKPASVGSVTSDILANDQQAKIFGKTSKGVFIKTSGKWLFFLSFEQFRGPLTITFETIHPPLRLLSVGDPIQIASQSIFHAGLDLVIPIAGSQVWQPLPPPLSPCCDTECQDRLVHFAQEITAKKNGVGLGGMIPLLLGLANSDASPQLITGINWADIQQIRYFIRKAEASPLARLLSTILGSGPGLTPSADDFILGILLTLNRWQNPPWTADHLRELNFQVVEAAYQKTTTLSANLIECAALGLADERLVNTLDWIMTDTDQKKEIVDQLLGWGSSSGVDAFVGMAISLYSD